MTAICPPETTTRPHLSASQLRNYADCPLQWYLSRHYEPEFVPDCLIFGSAVHRALQVFYENHLQGEKPGLQQMLAAYCRVWDEEQRPVRFGKTADRKSLDRLAQSMISAFLEQASPGLVIGVEEPFECQLDNSMPMLVGRIDLIEIRTSPDGQRRLCLTDFKTARNRPADASAMNPEQLVLYSIAAERGGLLRQFDLPLCLNYLVITKTRSPAVVSLQIKPDFHDKTRTIARAASIYRGMQAGVIHPNHSWKCAACGYERLCRKWPNLPEQ